MKMIENGQNKADFSGVCHCQITTYDKESEVPRGPWALPKLQEPLLISTGRPSSTGESRFCTTWRWCHKVGGPIQSFRSAVCRTAGFPPGSGLETCPSVGAVARSGDLATTWSVIAKTPGNYSRLVP